MMVGLKLSLLILFHPLDCFDVTKRDQKKFPMWYAALLFFLSVAAQFFFVYYVHYPLSEMRPQEANLFLEIVKVLLPVLTWVVASYAITTIMEGESHFTEIFKATSLCMVPYILVTVVLTLLSRVMSLEENGLFLFIQSLALVITVLLILTSLKVLNGYSFGKMAAVAALSVGAMLVIWAIALLLFALTSQLFYFFDGLWLEIKMASGR